jgi:threonine dehydrogenase-like Zn-dependent dehydrogenase
MTARMWAWEVQLGRLDWVDRELPTAGADDALIRVTSAGVCGSDVAKLSKAVIPTPPGQPWRPGHEIVGWSNDPDGRSHLVAVNALVPCGECARCRDGDINVCPGLRMVGWHLPGGFAPYVAVPRRNVVELPPQLDEGTAVLADPMAVAVHGIRCGLGRKAGRLAIIGSGALGAASAAYAASRGWQVEVLVRDPARVGVTSDTLGVPARPLASAPPRGFDAVVDAAGGADDTPFLAALDVVRDGGTVVVQTAYYPGVRLSRDLREPIRRGLTIVGSFTFCRRDGDDFTEALAFLATESNWAKPFVEQRYALADLPRALTDLRSSTSRRPTKVVLAMA